MQRKLKKHFPSLQYHEAMPAELDPDLTWFIADNGHVVGILPDEIEEKDAALLSIFLKPLKNVFPRTTEEEKNWRNYVQSEMDYPEIDYTYQLIYFQFPPKQLQPTAFKEAINTLFEKDMIILWESESEGVMVDIKKDRFDDVISLDEIIDILMSDLYVKIRFFVGPQLSSLQHVKHQYERLVARANTVFSYTENNVVSYIEAIPFLLIDQATPDLKVELQHLILQESRNDKEFIKMIEVFLRSNLNVSTAAKQLYMHRNSLQYRIEKFYEKTGLDIRNFHHALTVYLALLAKKEQL